MRTKTRPIGSLITRTFLVMALASCGASDDETLPSPASELPDADATHAASSDGGSKPDTDPASQDGRTPATDTASAPAPSPCEPRPLVVPEADFFVDISDASGIRAGNYNPTPAQSIPINDHSRLAVTDIDGDGWDDIVMHSLYPNPQQGIPFEHLVFRNQGDGTFEDWSDRSGLRNVQAAFFVFGDLDNDGDQDLFAGVDVPLPGVRHQVMLNDGTGSFSPVPNSGPDMVNPTVAGNAVLADFDQDAILDLYIGNGHTSSAAPDLYFKGFGDGTFALVSDALTDDPARPTNGTVTCDYDNDGDLDIFVSTYGVSIQAGLNILWENDGGRFSNVAVDRGFASLPSGNFWLGLGDQEEPGKGPGSWMGSNGFGLDCQDLNNDGWMDIFLTTISHPVSSDYSRKWSDPTQVLINQGATGTPNLVDESLSRQLPFNEGDVDGAAIDFDNDGRLDLSISRDKKYEGNYTELDQKAWFGLLRQGANGDFESLGPASGINSLDASLGASITECSADSDCPDPSERCLNDRCRHPCTSSADCDGRLESCHSQGFCRLLWGMKNAQNHAWADFDHDGDLDLLVGGRDMGGGRPNFLFRNEIGASNRWLALRLEGDGVAINRDAIGARVSLVFEDQRLTRELRSSRGMHSSADTRAVHFGLGDLSCDYSLHIRWPNGEELSIPSAELGQDSWWRVIYPGTLQPLSATR